MKRVFLLFFYLPCIMSFSFCTASKKSWEWEWDKESNVDNSDKPRFICIDASANFPDYANSKENILRDLTLAKDAGFTDIQVLVRPTNGDALFKTDKVDQVKWLSYWDNGVQRQLHRTADWDYLEAFIEAGHSLGLKIHALFDTFTGSRRNSLGHTGLLARDPSKKHWASSLLQADGTIKNGLDADGGETVFFNPVHEEVQDYLLGLLEDLATNYPDLDGIIIDRGRFADLSSDFSDYTKAKFEEYIGTSLANFPADVVTGEMVASSSLPSQLPPYFKEWIEFRAKTIYDFMGKARSRVKAINSKLSFSVYVGGWYSTYYSVGVNWASKSFDAAKAYPKWASSKLKDYGYASLMDYILIGAYAGPTRIYGDKEWSVQGFCLQAKDKIKSDAIVIGGIDIGNGAWATTDRDVVNQAIVESIVTATNSSDGCFVFDIIHLKKRDQWAFAKEGIRKASVGK